MSPERSGQKDRPMKVVDEVRRWLMNRRRGAVMLDLLEEVAAERPGGATLEAMEEIHEEALRRGIERDILYRADDGSISVRR